MSTIPYFSDIHIEIRDQERRPGWARIQPLALGPDLTERQAAAAPVA